MGARVGRADAWSGAEMNTLAKGMGKQTSGGKKNPDGEKTVVHSKGRNENISPVSSVD